MLDKKLEQKNMIDDPVYSKIIAKYRKGLGEKAKKYSDEEIIKIYESVKAFAHLICESYWHKHKHLVEDKE